MQFEGCTFSNCALSLTKDINLRSTVSNVDVNNCAVSGCNIGPAIFENVQVTGLSTADLLIVWGAIFNRVTLSGPIGKVKLNQYVHPVDRTEPTQGPFDEHRKKFYESIEWALDISGAEFKEFELRGIPAKLIRRDTETQVVVTRERAQKLGWEDELDPSNKLWPFMIKLFLSDGDKDMVLVAPKGAVKKKRDELIRGLQELRALGVAEPE